VGVPTRRVTGQWCQSIVDFGLYNHLVIPPMIPLVEAEGGDIRSCRLAPVLEVVGPQVA
jgi:hypothetical protein